MLGGCCGYTTLTLCCQSAKLAQRGCLRLLTILQRRSAGCVDTISVMGGHVGGLD